MCYLDGPCIVTWYSCIFTDSAYEKSCTLPSDLGERRGSVPMVSNLSSATGSERGSDHGDVGATPSRLSVSTSNTFQQTSYFFFFITFFPFSFVEQNQNFIYFLKKFIHSYN